jgi:hypothetical protein
MQSMREATKKDLKLILKYFICNKSITRVGKEWPEGHPINNLIRPFIIFCIVYFLNIIDVINSKPHE